MAAELGARIFLQPKSWTLNKIGAAEGEKNRIFFLLTYLFTYWFTYLVTYLLTPWSRALLEKLTGSQLVKKFPPFYGTRMFITAFASACPLSPFWANSIQFIPPHPTSWRSILILSSYLRLHLPRVSFPQVFPPKPRLHLFCPPYMLHAPPISFFSFWSPDNIRWGVKITKFLNM